MSPVPGMDVATFKNYGSRSSRSGFNEFALNGRKTASFSPGNDMTSPTHRPKMTSAEESDLIRKILGGRPDLFEDLIAPHLATLLHTVRATIGGRPEAEDIVQQTALKAFTHLDQFRFEARFSTWLIRIGLNEVRTWQRNYPSSRFLALDLTTLTPPPVADENHSPLAEYQRSEASVRMRAVLAWLPEKYRTVILLRDLEDLSIAEVAQRLALTISAVKTRHFRARQKMAKFFRPLRQSQPEMRTC
jgi:RNA polymerase sigma factor (sigma-70 family)